MSSSLSGHGGHLDVGTVCVRQWLVEASFSMGICNVLGMISVLNSTCGGEKGSVDRFSGLG